MSYNQRILIPLILAKCALISGFTYAQNEITLEEIVVTAQKRAENLQSTPIAVSAFTATTLENKGIDNISELANFTPNLVFDTTSPVSGLSSGAVVFIRGVGNTDFSLTTDPGVGSYVDGVYVSRSAGGVLDVLDIERIEVLRGPQGTLFGRNTIGGAISITSRKPAEELQGAVEVTVGDFSRFDVRASIDVPFSEKFRSNFALSSKTRDGFIDRVLVGDELGDEDKLAFRANLVYEASDQLDFQLSYDRTDIDEASAGSQIVGFTPGAGTIGYGLATFGNIPAGLADLAQYVTKPGDDISFGTGVSGTDLKIDGLAFTVNWHGEAWNLKYIGAYRETSGSFNRDPDNSPVALTETLNPNYDHEQTSHELQITGDMADGKLQYVAGLYSFNEEGTDNVFVPVFLPAADLSFGFPAAIRNFADVDNSSEAVYAQINWNVSDAFAFTLGARYTEDEKEYKYTQYIAANAAGGPFPFPTPPTVDENGATVFGFLPIVGNGSGIDSTKFNETSFKFGADYTLESGTLLYYSYSEGYKSGGFVLRYVETQPAPLTFDPELLSTHEIGVKWESADSRVRLNAAAFSSDYEDAQVTFFDLLGGPITANAGTIDIQGLELELTALVTDNLLFEVGYGYTDAEYASIRDIQGLSLTLDPATATLVNTPENSLSLGAQYTLPLKRGDALALRVDYAYKDDIFNDAQNSLFLFQESYDEWNLSLRYTSADEKWSVRAFIDNVSDERYIESGDSNFGLGFHEANVNRPREYGMTVKYNF